MVHLVITNSIEKMDLSVLKTQRGAIKGRLTRLYNYIMDLEPDADLNMHDISVRNVEITSLGDRFEEVQLSIERIDTAGNHDTEREDFEEKYYAARSRMDALLNPTSRTS